MTIECIDRNGDESIRVRGALRTMTKRDSCLSGTRNFGLIDDVRNEDQSSDHHDECKDRAANAEQHISFLCGF